MFSYYQSRLSSYLSNYVVPRRRIDKIELTFAYCDLDLLINGTGRNSETVLKKSKNDCIKLNDN